MLRLAALPLLTLTAVAQRTPPPPQIVTPLTPPTLSPGVLLLLDLEQRFARDVEARGGAAFRDWFALDGVTLNNGKAAVIGFRSITAQATWDPRLYQLTWTTEGAQMGPSNDMGFTWGRYTGRSRDPQGKPVETSGRYITVWRKIEDGKWKVALDASANDAPPAGAQP
jgi:ketosteroid isomerase-like protein